MLPKGSCSSRPTYSTWHTLALPGTRGPGTAVASLECLCSVPLLFGKVLPVLRNLCNIAQRRGFSSDAANIPMHKTNFIVMQAPKMAIFETAANLELWPKILPHYRYIRFLERGVNRNVVVMAARRSGIPISWTSEQIIDRNKCEIHFHHLKGWTKGMRVVWTFSDTHDGELVTISHDLRFRFPALAALVEPVIGDFFIHNVASKTLRCMKAYLETTTDKVNI
jgi:ribosome-associated toxin RatA of RatAB toxin-antitoxin module